MKNKFNLAFVIFTLVFLTTYSFAQTNSKATITKESGGSIQTPLEYGIVLNKNSSLNREWITVHDESLPITISSTIGVKTIYESAGRSGDYLYKTGFSLQAKEPITAFELRFLLFDLWGKHIKTLSFTEVSDFTGSKDFVGSWKVFNENEVSEYYASIAYLARIRTQSGRVVEANPVVVLDEARKFSKKFTEDSLNPTVIK